MSGLRRAWHRSPLRIEVLKAAEVEIVPTNKDGTPAKRAHKFYVCRSCGTLGKKQKSPNHPKVHVDHIDPVIPIDGRDLTWNEKIDRLFCISAGVDNLQVLCANCHSDKTKVENKARREAKKRD